MASWHTFCDIETNLNYKSCGKSYRPQTNFRKNHNFTNGLDARAPSSQGKGGCQLENDLESSVWTRIILKV